MVIPWEKSQPIGSGSLRAGFEIPFATTDGDHTLRLTSRDASREYQVALLKGTQAHIEVNWTRAFSTFEPACRLFTV